MTVERYALFLHGVNVGGIRLTMADVAAALTDAGFTAVRTVLASGNVTAESAAPVESVRERALAALDGPGAKIERGDGVRYWQVPKAATLDSAIGKTMGKARYKASTTTRNLRTLVKTLAG